MMQKRFCLQRMLWPEYGLCTDTHLFVRLKGPAGLDLEAQNLSFDGGGQASFETYANLLSYGKWQGKCGLQDLALQLEGDGHFEVVVKQAWANRSPELLYSSVHILSESIPLCLEVQPITVENTGSVVFFELRALGQARLTGAQWQTADAPKRKPQVALSITTFRREEAVARTVTRFERYMQTSPIADHLHMIVVDNGQSADVQNSDVVSVYPNANMGGSGGFARGLLEARARGASHCLFMDDDASIQMDSLERSWTFLAYADDPDTALAGALTRASHKWSIWENGALFDRQCRPQHMGTDLRDPRELAKLEHETTPPVPHTYYGGWWFFLFPIAAADKMPFPFFVRGDDVSFSLVHDFKTTSLNGVVTFPDEDFSEKESPLTVYLDLRSHLAHHLSIPHMELSPLRTCMIAWWFFARSLIGCHYETLQAINIALGDVLEGPNFFADNADMATRRADLGALRIEESWTPIDPNHPPGKRGRWNPENPLHRLLMKLTLNGHLIPFFRLIGNHTVIQAEDRGGIRPLWGAARLSFVSTDGTRAYTVTHSKAKALAQLWDHLRLSWRLLRTHRDLLQTWRAGYDRLATEDFWRTKLDLPQASAQDRAAE